MGRIKQMMMVQIHYDHTFFLCGKRAHDRRLDDGHQRHIAVRGHSDSAKQFRRQLAGNENGCRAVRTADDADGAGLRSGKTKQLRSDVSSENAKLCGSAQQQALRVGDQRAEIRHRTDAKEDQRRINAQLDAKIQHISQPAMVQDLAEHRIQRRVRAFRRDEILHVDNLAKRKVRQQHAEGDRQKQKRLELLAYGKINQPAGDDNHNQIARILHDADKAGFIGNTGDCV